MVILQEPPPWQYTVVVISSRVRRACISSWEGTNSLVFVLFRESLMNCAYLSISEPGKRSFTLIGKRSKNKPLHSETKQECYQITWTTGSRDINVKHNCRKTSPVNCWSYGTCSHWSLQSLQWDFSGANEKSSLNFEVSKRFNYLCICTNFNSLFPSLEGIE